jgi:hypothetical protein
MFFFSIVGMLCIERGIWLVRVGFPFSCSFRRYPIGFLVAEQYIEVDGEGNGAVDNK